MNWITKGRDHFINDWYSIDGKAFFIVLCLLYFAAFFIWNYGVPDNEYCKPDSLIQAHGIWHLLSAVATYFFFLHYRSEKV